MTVVAPSQAHGRSSSASTDSQRWVLALASAASLMVSLDNQVVATALSTIRAHLHASITGLEWTVNAYTLTFAVLLMTATALGDRLGRRRLLLAGLVVFSGASAACALSHSAGMLIGARAVQGIGGAMVMPNAIALLGAAFGPERRGWAMGIFGSVTGLGVMSGPVLGGAIAQGIDWQWIFWINVPIGLATAVLVRTRIRESAGARRTPDLLGLGLVSGGCFGVVWGLVRGNTAGWGSVEVLASVIGGGVLLVAFVVWGLRASEPMLPMRLFRSRAFAAGNASTFLLFASMFGAVFFMAQFQQITLGQGPLVAGLRLLPWTATLFLIAPRAGKLVDRIGERPLIVWGLAMQAAGMGWIALIAHPGLPYAEMIAPMVITGVGASMTIPAVQSAVVGSVEPQQIGVAAGTFASMRQLGGAFGVAILVAVFTAVGSYASPQEFSSGFAAAIGACVGLSLAGALAAVALPATRRVALVGLRIPRVTGPHRSTHASTKSTTTKENLMQQTQPKAASENESSTARIRHLGRGVYRLGTPKINWYAIEDRGRLTIIDAGLPKHAKMLEADVRSIGHELADIDALVLTHAHPDHIGIAGFLHERGVDVHVHRDDVAMLANKGQAPGAKKERSMLSYAGHATFWGLMGHMMRGGMMALPNIKDPLVFQDGDVLDVPGHPRVIHTPGHSNGHCAFSFENHGVLFVGDALCTWNPFTGREGPQLMPAGLAISSDQALRSLERIEGIDCGLLLPGHGEPWTDGAASAVSRVRAAGRS